MTPRRMDGPPEAWLALVGRFLPAHRRDEVLGDLVELWYLRAARGARFRRLRFWRDVWSLAAPVPRSSSRAVRRIPPMELLLTDIRSAWRGLRSSPGSTLVAFVILAVTIAAGTVTFSVVDTVAIRPLPFAAPGGLIALGRIAPTSSVPGPTTPQDYFTWADHARTVSGLAAARFGAPLRFVIDGATVAATTVRTTGNLFDVLGVRPEAGRLLSSADETPGGDAMVISHEFWVTKLGRDPNIVGRRLALTDGARRVVGVLPPGVSFPISTNAPDAYIPYIAGARDRDPADGGRAFAMNVVGRLAPGATLANARAEFQGLSAAMIAAFPQSFERTLSLDVQSLQDRVIGPAKRWLYLALMAVGVVLLTACLNVANLFLARTAVRTREIVTRLALGASRGRVARVLLIEGAILALAAGAAGIACAFWGLGVVKAGLPADLARTSHIALDGRVLAVSIGAALACGLVFASAPAWFATRADLAGSMRTGSTGAIGGGRLRTLKTFLIVELTCVSVLLVACALLVTSFVRITTADLGFDRENVVAVPIFQSVKALPSARRPDAIATLINNALARVRQVPGVLAAGLVQNGVPLGGTSVRYSIAVPGRGDTGQDMLETRMITPGYVEAMGLRLLEGRTITASDGRGAPHVALIDDVAARQFFGGVHVLGRTFDLHGSRTIVGVLQAVRLNGPEQDLRPEVYLSAEQWDGSDSDAYGDIVARVRREPASMIPAIAAAIGPELHEARLPGRTVDDAFRRLTAGHRFNAAVMAIFGGIAVLIGAMGIYGAMAFLVVQRVREIGVRMALGASPDRVLRTVLRDASACVVLGLVIGLAGARVVSSLFTALVFGVTPTSPSIYAGVAALLMAVGLLAAFIPARRAARLDPLTALRRE